jgi:lambda family phage tail tape measure protein
MTTSDAGQVSVRFSVQDAEVVREALKRLGDDGEKALKRFDASAQPIPTHLKAVSDVINEMRGRVVGLALSIGPLGSVLVGMGPAGAAAAAGVALVVKAWAMAVEQANALADKASALSNLADVAGLTTDQIQGTVQATARQGKTFEETSGALEKFTIAWDELRHGSGAALDQLRRVAPELVNQLGAAKDAASALDILARAYAKATDEAQRNAIARAFFGRGGVSTGNAILSNIGADGINKLAAEATAAGGTIDRALIERLKNLKVQIEETNNRARILTATLFSEDVLTRELRAAELYERIAKAARDIIEADPAQSAWGRFWEQVGQAMSEGSTAGASPPRNYADEAARNRFLAGQEPEGLVFNPAAHESKKPATISPQLALSNMEKWTSVLGSAMTIVEQYDLAIARLNAKVDEGKVSIGYRTRAEEALKLAQQQSIVATREKLGVASEEEILSARLAEILDLDAKGYIKTQQEKALADRVQAKAARDAHDAMTVRGSETPALTQLSIQSDHLRENLDSGLAQSLSGITTDLADVRKGAISASEGFDRLIDRIFTAVENAMLMKAVVGPLAGLASGGLDSILSGMSGGGSWNTGGMTSRAAAGYRDGGAFDRYGVVPFASGGIVSRPTIFPFANGTGLMGEAGPEGILPLSRMASGKLGVQASGGGGVSLHIHEAPGVAVADIKHSRDPGGQPRMDILLRMIEDHMVGSIVDGNGRVGSAIKQRFVLDGTRNMG